MVNLEPVLASMPINRAKVYALATLILVISLTIFAVVTYYAKLSWTIFGGATGAIFGLVIGFIVIVKVPQKIQIAGVGAICGIGTDQILNTLQNKDSNNVIGSLSKMVGGLVNSVIFATIDTGMPAPPAIPVSVGFWICTIVIAIMMLFGSLEKES
jgi:hypothetical protein